MYHLKVLIKDVWPKFSRKDETPHLTVRMSDISDLSITSRTAPLYSSTLNSKGVTPEKSSRRKMNNLRTNPDSSSEEDAIETRNNQRNLNPKILDSPDPKHETRLKLKVVITKADQSSRVVNVLNDLSKPQSPMAEKNTSDHVTSAKDSPARPNRNMPVMGRSALLKKANVDNTDSLIIYDLITEKYHGVINHYLDRSYRRRKMRSESPSNYSDTVFSSLPAYSPLSLSSVGTPGSELVDETEGFKFPGVGENILAKLPQPDLRFIASTDDMNVETTIEDEEVSSTGTSATEKSTTSYSDYDPHKFLDHALGEITDLSAAYEFSQGMDENHRTNLEQLKSDSIGTSNLSLLLSKASSLYMLSASRRNINNNFRTGPLEPGIPESPEKDQLMKELSLQNEIMFQVSKALNYCRTTKKFESSVELVEAEKILLVASCTKEVLTKEIQNIEDESYEPEISSKCSGEVTLSNLTFYPKEGRKDEKSHRDFTEYFLAVLTCGSVVLASEILTADDKGVVEVARKFSFANLAIDFEISVCVYAMRVGNKIHQQQEQKKTCSSPKRIFFHLRRSTKKPKDPSDTVYIKPSSFHMWGKCDIRSSDLSRSGDEGVLRLKMHHTPLGSSLSGDVSAKINTSLKFTNRISGFLTIGTENEHGCTIWNRRWCVLEGFTMRYWNYPSEEVSNALGTVDLRNCPEQRISAADRSICARPRTLMLPIGRNNAVKKYLLSADDCISLEEWDMELNDVLCSLRVWNRIEVS